MKGWWELDVDGQKHYAYATYRADALYSVMRRIEFSAPSWDDERDMVMVAIQRCERPTNKRRPNPRNWLAPPGNLL